MMNREARKASDDALWRDDALTSATRYVIEGPIQAIQKSVFGRSLFVHERVETVDPEPIAYVKKSSSLMTSTDF